MNCTVNIMMVSRIKAGNHMLEYPVDIYLFINHFFFLYLFLASHKSQSLNDYVEHTHRILCDCYCWCCCPHPQLSHYCLSTEIKALDILNLRYKCALLCSCICKTNVIHGLVVLYSEFIRGLSISFIPISSELFYTLFPDLQCMNVL